MKEKKIIFAVSFFQHSGFINLIKPRVFYIILIFLLTGAKAVNLVRKLLKPIMTVI